MSNDSPRDKDDSEDEDSPQSVTGENDDSGSRERSNSLVSRGGFSSEDDPERSKSTGSRSQLSRRRRLDPESSGTELDDSKGPPSSQSGSFRRSESSGVVSRRAQPKGLSAEWEAPPGKMSREMGAADYETGDNYGPEPSAGYRTGSDYRSFDDDEDEISLKGKVLEGDGLDALDPDLDGMPSQTGRVSGVHRAEDDPEDENQTTAGPPLKLEIISGPDTGKRKKFRGVRMVIGRTPGVDLQLTDQSVSRRHVELVAGDGGVMLRDLGSGNGTKVNGEKETEKLLVDGDVIHIGKTKMRFVDEAYAIKKAREEAEKKEAEAAEGGGAEGGEGVGTEENPDGLDAEVAGEEGAGDGEGEGNEGEEGLENSPDLSELPVWQRPLALFKALSFKRRMVLLAVAAVFFIVLISLATSRPNTPAPAEISKRDAVEKMQAARDAVRAERYQDAIRLIEEAEKLSPGIDKTRLLAQARTELSVVTALDEVKRLMEADKFEEAKAALAKAPQGSVRTEEAKKKLGDQIAEAEAAYRKRRIQDMIAAGEVEAAEQSLAELPEADRRELFPILEQAQRARDDAQAQDRQRAALAAENRQERGQMKREDQLILAFSIVARKFAGHEWARGAAECDRVIESNPGDDEIRKRCKQLKQWIPAFGKLYEEGMRKFRANEIAQAAKPLHKALELYQQINFETAMGDEIRQTLAQAALSAGKEAVLREDLISAAEFFREASKMDPEDTKSKEMLADVVHRAEDLYQNAYMIRDRDPVQALKLFRTVVELTPPGSAVHEKAKNHIAAMQPH